jgi:hypothetical protein
MTEKTRWIGTLALAVILITACGPGAAELSVDDVQALLRNISQSPLGIRITAADGDIGIDSAGGRRGGYRITVENPACVIGSEIFQQMELPVQDFELPFSMRELVLIYDPDEPLCQIESAADIRYSLDFSRLIPAETRKPKEGEAAAPTNLDFSCSLDDLAFKDYNISPLLDSQGETLLNILFRLMRVNPSWEGAVSGMSVEFSLPQAPDSKVSVEKAQTRLKAEPEIFTAFFPGEDKGPFLVKPLEEGRDLWDIHSSLKNMSMVINSPEGALNVNMTAGDVAYYLKPTSDRNAYAFGFDYNIEGMEVRGDQLDKVEALTNIERARFQFSIEGLSPEFLTTYFEMMRQAQAASINQDPAVQQEMGMNGLALVGSLAQSKPVISMSLKPFEHRIGKMEAEGRFQFIRLGPPVGKATIRLFDFEKLGKAIKDNSGIPEEKIDDLMRTLAGVFEVDGGGDGLLTFEIKEEDGSNFYLNGKPKSFGGVK